MAVNLLRLVREFRRHATSPVWIGVWIAVSTILSLSGPFMTYAAPFGLRAAFWFAVMAIAIVLSLVYRVLGEALFGRRAVLKTGALMVVLHALTFAPIVWALYRVTFAPDRMIGLGGMIATVAAIDAAVRLLEFAIRKSIVRGGARGTAGRASRQSDSQVAALAEAAANPQPDTGVCPDAWARTARLMQRVPAEKRGRLVRLAVRDHYVDVVTDRGVESILMRFSDAIAETEGLPGLQVHRSHWIALDRVDAVARDRGRLFLTMADGHAVPVSKSRVADVERAGLLERL